MADAATGLRSVVRPPMRSVVTLLGTSLVGRMPQAMSSLALVQIALSSGAGYAAAGTLTTTYVIATTVGAPALGLVIDRTGRTRATLLLASLISAGAFVGLVLSVEVVFPFAVAAAVVAGASAPPLEPVLRASWPRLASPGPELHRLFAVDAAAQEVLFILGPLATAGAGALLGVDGAVISMAALTITGTSLFCLHRTIGVRERDASVPARSGSALRLPIVRSLVAQLVLAGLPVGVLTITSTRFAALHADPPLAAWGLAVNAIGALCGAVAVSRIRGAHRPGRAIPALLVGYAVLYLPTAVLAAPPALWLVFALLSGLSLPPLLTQVFALVAARVPAAAATEANAWVVSAFSSGIAAGTFIAATAAGGRGAGGIVGAVVVASALAGLAALVARAGLRPSRT